VAAGSGGGPLPIRQPDLGPGAGRHVDADLQHVAAPPPGAQHPPVRAVVLGLGPLDAAARPRLDDEPPVPRRSGPGIVEQPEPGDVRVEERDDRTLAVVLRAEPLSAGRAAGLALGFAGVAVLVGVDVAGDRLGLLGAGMVLFAALSYAVATIMVQRRAADIPPEALAAGTTTIATLVLAPFAAAALPHHAVRPVSWAALAVLGVFCTAAALLAFYGLIGLAGSNRAGLVTYVNPVVAVLLGVVLLDEPVGPSTVAGFALVVAGCWLSTRPAPAVRPIHDADRSFSNAA
jgi:uncharacterized membrane protein